LEKFESRTGELTNSRKTAEAAGDT
jgi:hypothetical protein